MKAKETKIKRERTLSNIKLIGNSILFARLNFPSWRTLKQDVLVRMWRDHCWKWTKTRKAIFRRLLACSSDFFPRLSFVSHKFYQPYTQYVVIGELTRQNQANAYIQSLMQYILSAHIVEDFVSSISMNKIMCVIIKLSNYAVNATLRKIRH